LYFLIGCPLDKNLSLTLVEGKERGGKKIAPTKHTINETKGVT
jgi:hypothetical protein